MKNRFAFGPALKSFIKNPIKTMMDALTRLANTTFSLNHEAALLRQSLVTVSLIIIWLMLSYFYLSPDVFLNLINTWRAALKARSTPWRPSTRRSTP